MELEKIACQQCASLPDLILSSATTDHIISIKLLGYPGEPCSGDLVTLCSGTNLPLSSGLRITCPHLWLGFL